MNKLKIFYFLFYSFLIFLNANSITFGNENKNFYKTKSKLVKKIPYEPKKPFYSTQKEGWYSYKEILEEKKEKPQDKKNNYSKSIDRIPEEKTDSEIYNMHPDDLHKYERKTLKYAVQTGEEKDVERYWRVVNIGKVKAEIFANQTSVIGFKNPDKFLKDNYTHPHNVPGINAYTKTREDEVKKTIAFHKKNYGLIFLTQPNCHYCTEQQQILEYFYNKYKWLIQEFNIVQKSFLISKFNIQNTPTLILISKKTKKFITVGAGVTSLTKLEVNIYKGINYLEGIRNQKLYNNYNYEVLKTEKLKQQYDLILNSKKELP